jgi:hypothetical protein
MVTGDDFKAKVKKFLNKLYGFVDYAAIKSKFLL